MPRRGAAWLLAVALGGLPAQATAPRSYEFNDSHFHLTNYVQEGIDVRALLQLMGSRVGRSTLFGIPLQQTWSYRNSGDARPTYYLDTDAPLYYYSFTDAYIAEAYRSLPREQQSRLDPMITGFNPSDMYAADHVRRVLETYPGVFSGIGEFSIHKEFVSSKVAGETASLTDPALDRLLDFAGEVGLVVLIHNDIDVPFAKPEAQPMFLTQMKALLARHPKTKIIWAHVGLGRVVYPTVDYVGVVEGILNDPALSHVCFDISWEEVAKYLLAKPEITQRAARVMNRHPDRILFGTDVVAPKTTEAYFKPYEDYAPLWKQLSPEASEGVRKKNYERLFDEARRKVRAWEQAHVNAAPSGAGP